MGARGFTLVELLVTIAIFLLVEGTLLRGIQGKERTVTREAGSKEFLRQAPPLVAQRAFNMGIPMALLAHRTGGEWTFYAYPCPGLTLSACAPGFHPTLGEALGTLPATCRLNGLSSGVVALAFFDRYGRLDPSSPSSITAMCRYRGYQLSLDRWGGVSAINRIL